MRFRIGIQLASIPGTMAKALSTASRLRVAGVELSARGPLAPKELSETGRRQLRKMLTDAGVRVSCLTFATRRGYDVVENLDRRIAATCDALDLAHSLGTNVVVNRIGCVPTEAGDPRRAILSQALLDLGRHGERCGAILAARTGSEPGPVLAEFLGSLPPAALGVDLDPAGLIANRYSVAEALPALAPQVVHVHACDADYDPSVGRCVEVTLGRGMADFPRIAAILDTHQYRGFFTIQRQPSAEVVSELDDAVAYLRSLRQELE